MRFPAIDGLRAWLAWAVVMAHLVQVTALDQTSALFHAMRAGGDAAVSVFIMISGFVITGLLVEKTESWPAFVVRRAMRLWPVYLVGLILATLVLARVPDAIAQAEWLKWPGSDYAPLIKHVAADLGGRPAETSLLDLTLLQGVVPNQLMLDAQFAVLPPAWSLSLEWQFYLVAPFLVAALRKPGTSVAAIIACIAAFGLYRAGVFGAYGSPSFLPAAILYFLVGIASRLWIDRFSHAPPQAAIGLAGMAMFGGQTATVFLWLAFVVFMSRRQEWTGLIAGAVARAGKLAFESAPARFLGERSYPTYVVHWPLLQLAMVLILPRVHGGQLETMLLLGATTTALTLALSILLHVWLEVPAMRLGSTWARRIDRRSKRNTMQVASGG